MSVGPVAILIGGFLYVLAYTFAFALLVMAVLAGAAVLLAAVLITVIADGVLWVRGKEPRYFATTEGLRRFMGSPRKTIQGTAWRPRKLARAMTAEEMEEINIRSSTEAGERQREWQSRNQNVRESEVEAARALYGRRSAPPR